MVKQNKTKYRDGYAYNSVRCSKCNAWLVYFKLDSSWVCPCCMVERKRNFVYKLKGKKLIGPFSFKSFESGK